MIGGMARASRIFGKPEWLASARAALDFIRTTMWKDGKLLATSKDGHAHLDAYLDDMQIAYCGRYGDWGYLWTDESFISGERAAERALALTVV